MIFIYKLVTSRFNIFLTGSTVLWNMTDMESSNVLIFLRQFEEDSYSERLTQTESEVMKYKYASDGR